MALKQVGLKTTEPQKSFVNKGKSKVIISNNLGAVVEDAPVLLTFGDCKTQPFRI